MRGKGSAGSSPPCEKSRRRQPARRKADSSALSSRIRDGIAERRHEFSASATKRFFTRSRSTVLRRGVRNGDARWENHFLKYILFVPFLWRNGNNLQR